MTWNVKSRTRLLGLFALWLAGSILVLPSPAVAQSVDAQGASVGGVVTDAATGASLAGATVRIEGTDLGVLTDGDGRYLLLRAPSGPGTLRVEQIGYATARIPITVPARGMLRRDVALATRALEMPGVVVTADPAGRARGELGTATVVGREAIAAQTATTLAGVLELVPGTVLSPPGLTGVQQVALRTATGAGGEAQQLSAFGTLIILDGVPLSNNANLQSLGPRGEVALATSANGGIDLRRIPASTIERIEVIRGVPSARYGDLTQGAIVVETRTDAFEPEIALQFDANALNLSTVGGHRRGSHALSGGVDVARYRSQPGLSPDEAQRFAGQLAHRATFGREDRLVLDTRLDVFRMRDDRPERPEINPDFIREVSEGGVRLSERAQLRLPRGARLQFTGAIDASQQRAFTQLRRASGAMPFTDRLTEGRAVGRFIGGEYVSQLELSGDPRMVYGRLEAELPARLFGADHEARAGIEARREWNSGAGYQFDMQFPPQISATGIQGFDRPRRFDEVPPLATSALYVDDRLRWLLPGDMDLILQAGARLEVLHEGGTWVSGVRDAVAQPRVNAEFAPTRWLRLRSGWGRTAKVPPLGRLSPASQFFDLVNVNWYANDPAERLAVLTTFLVDPTNPDLGMAVGTKAEAGIEVGMGASVLSLVGFRERIEGAVGIRPEPGWLPRDRFRLADSIPGSGRPPELVEPPIGADTIPLMVQRPANNTEIRTEGIEVVALLPEIPRLRLRVQAQASWLRTRQEKSDLDFGAASRFREFQVSSNIPRIPYYEDPVRVGRQVLATYRVVHHQPRVGLVITATVQHNLHDENRTEAATDTLAFIGYLTRDGQLTEVPDELRTLPEYADLRRGRAAFTSEQSAPGDWFMNLQVSKTLPLDGRLSFWAFNALDRRGYYGEFGTAARLYPATRFGMELVLPPRAVFGGRL